MPKGAGMLALLIGGKKPPVSVLTKKKKAKTPRVSREDLKIAARDFANAKDDDARVEALLNFQELSRDYTPND
tara:strand:+ start:780 stop:998 length:219 start_codon:yes stop_codon:yes gene_type:complete